MAHNERPVEQSIMDRVQIADRMHLVNSIREMRFMHVWNATAGTCAGFITIMAITMGMFTFGFQDIASVGMIEVY